MPVLGLQDPVRDHASDFGGYTWVRRGSWTVFVPQKTGHAWAGPVHVPRARQGKQTGTELSPVTPSVLWGKQGRQN